MTRPWRPGFRRVPPSVGSPAKLSEDVIARIVVEGYTGHVLHSKELASYADDGSPDEEGPEIHLQFSRAGSSYVRLLLGRMTEDELNALKYFIDFAFEQAIPVAQHRDRVAREAVENGDYSYTRSLRSTPSLHVLKRPGELFADELRQRREADVQGDEPGQSEHGGAGGDGGSVAVAESEDQVTGNDSSTRGVSSSTGPGIWAGDPSRLQRPDAGGTDPNSAPAPAG